MRVVSSIYGELITTPQLYRTLTGDLYIGGVWRLGEFETYANLPSNTVRIVK